MTTPRFDPRSSAHAQSATTGTEPPPRPVALVTGASAGIGAALAREYAAHGYDLVLVARREDALERVALSLRERYAVRVTVLAKDLVASGAAQEIVQDLEAHGIVVEALVNNAGFGLNGPFLEEDVVREAAMIQLNVGVLTELTRRVLPSLIARKRGHVLNVASTGAFQPGPFMAVYCATKAYVLSFSEALSEELRGTGVTVTALCPGATESEFAKVADMEGTKLFRAFRANVMSAEQVARMGFESASRGKRVRVTGLLNAVVARLVAWMPRGAVLRTAGGLLAPPRERERTLSESTTS